MSEPKPAFDVIVPFSQGTIDLRAENQRFQDMIAETEQVLETLEQTTHDTVLQTIQDEHESALAGRDATIAVLLHQLETAQTERDAADAAAHNLLAQRDAALAAAQTAQAERDALLAEPINQTTKQEATAPITQAEYDKLKHERDTLAEANAQLQKLNAKLQQAAGQEKSELVQEKSELVQEISELAQQIAELKARITELEKQVHRFGSKPKTSTRKKGGNKKPRGNKPGTRNHRPAPISLEHDQVEPIDVPLTSTLCPDCQVSLETAQEQATIIDTPKEKPRKIIIFNVATGRCPVCGRIIRGEHPELPKSQCGATAHRVGPRIMAQAIMLHYRFGITLRKLPDILWALSGIRLTQSAITQAVLKLIGSESILSKLYLNLRLKIAESAIVKTDDSTWFIEGKTCYIMVFNTKSTVFYQIRPQHRHQEVLEVLEAGGHPFAGILTCDRGTSYNAKKMDYIRQNKCIQHLNRNLEAVIDKKNGPAQQFALKLRELILEANKLWKEYQSGLKDKETYFKEAEHLLKKLDEHLKPRAFRDRDNQRLLNGIGGQHDKGHLLRFLLDPDISPTNNDSELYLRPVVIQRKNSYGSKNEQGALAYAMLVSVLTTARLRGLDLEKLIMDILQKKMPDMKKPEAESTAATN